LVSLFAAFVAMGILLSPQRGWAGLLTAGTYGVQIALGALIWIALLVVSGAKWWRPARSHFLRVASMLHVPMLVAAVAAIAGMAFGGLYPWAEHGAAEHSHLLHEKIGWLNKPFFVVRTAIIVVLWSAFFAMIRGPLQRVIAREASSARHRLARVCAAFIVVMALTISVAFWDWTMSLEPEWFSTMYGVYGFAGALQGGMAAVTALSIWYARRNPDSGISVKVRHDLGRLLFGFSMFWAYIWFCQYMLIWYANLPEGVKTSSTR
jgi:hypothetical protein